MPYPKTVVMFDLDGTLVDTLTDIANATNAVLEQHGLPTHPVDAYRQFVGNGAKLLIRRAIGDAATDELTDTIYNEYMDLYQNTCLETVHAYEGIYPMLESLEQRGAILAIVTNKPDPQAFRIADHLFGKGRFCAIRGTCEGRTKKPDPTEALQILREQGVPVTHAIFVGDSDVDVTTAQNIGCFGIGVEWGFRGSAELIEAGTQFLATHPEDIVTTFDNLFAPLS